VVDRNTGLKATTCLKATNIQLSYNVINSAGTQLELGPSRTMSAYVGATLVVEGGTRTGSELCCALACPVNPSATPHGGEGGRQRGVENCGVVWGQPEHAPSTPRKREGGKAGGSVGSSRSERTS
jgi:hypothetical protein